MEPKEGIEKNNNLNYSQKAQLIFFAALSSVTVIPQGVNAKDKYQEPIPIIQPLRPYGPNRSSVGEDAPVSTNAPIYICQDSLVESIIEDNEIENTNLSKFEFPLLSRYSLLSIENIQENNIIQTEQNTLLYFIPLDLNHNVIDSSEVKQFVVKPGMNFESAQKRVLIDEKGNKVEVQLLGNTFGGKNFVAAILTGFENNNSGKVEFVSNNSKEIEDVSTYIVTEDSVYPNKILNILKAFGYLTDVGQLKEGETYSYLSIVGLNNKDILRTYEKGRNSGGSVVTAGGVCATATAVSSLLYHVDGVQFPSLGVGRWTHPGPYAQGPFSPYWKEVDATVAYNGEGKMSFDFIWEMKKNGYIKIDAEILPTGLDYSQTDEDGLGYVSDVNAIISLAFTEKEPIGQKESLQFLWEKYYQFRETKHEQPLPLQDQLLEDSFKQSDDIKRAIDLLYIKNEPEKLEVLRNLKLNNNNLTYNIRR